MPKRIFTNRGFFATLHIRETMRRAASGKIRGVSLNEQRLTREQLGMLKRGGWRRAKAGDHWVWCSPRGKMRKI